MATRYICDQCGNEVTPQSLIRFKVEEVPPYAQGGAQGQYLGSSHGLSAAQAMANVGMAAQNPKLWQTFAVELCPTCATSWLSRVMNLTQRSGK